MILDRTAARRLALATAAGRTALGVAAVVVPSLPLAPWVGDARYDGATRLLARALGGRDLALGLGTIDALRHDRPAGAWILAGGLADAGDVVATLASWSRLPRFGRVAVLAAAGGGVAAAALSWSAGRVPAER